MIQTPLWGRFTLLIASCADGENRDCLVSLAIVPVENGESYAWLMDGQMCDPDFEFYLNQMGLIVNTDRCVMIVFGDFIVCFYSAIMFTTIGIKVSDGRFYIAWPTAVRGSAIDIYLEMLRGHL